MGDSDATLDREPFNALSKAAGSKLTIIFNPFSIPTSILFPELTQKKQAQPKIPRQ
jgi:hypothetical protein